MRVGAGGAAAQKQPTENVGPKSSVWVDGLLRLAETGFKGWRLSEGRWKLWLKSGCCERTDTAVRTRRLQARRVNLLPWHGASSLAQAASKLAAP